MTKELTALLWLPGYISWLLADSQAVSVSVQNVALHNSQAQRQKENTDKHTADNPHPSYTY